MTVTFQWKIIRGHKFGGIVYSLIVSAVQISHAVRIVPSHALSRLFTSNRTLVEHVGKVNLTLSLSTPNKNCGTLLRGKTKGTLNLTKTQVARHSV